MSEHGDGPLLGSVLHLLHRAGQVADELFAKEIPEGELTPRQYAVMLVLAENENISQTDLVNATGIDRSTLAEIVKRLITRDLLARRRSRLDARAYSVRLTEDGHAALQAARPKVQKVEEVLIKNLHPSHRAILADALSTIVRGSSGIVQPMPALAARR